MLHTCIIKAACTCLKAQPYLQHCAQHSRCPAGCTGQGRRPDAEHARCVQAAACRCGCTGPGCTLFHRDGSCQVAHKVAKLHKLLNNDLRRGDGQCCTDSHAGQLLLCRVTAAACVTAMAEPFSCHDHKLPRCIPMATVTVDSRVTHLRCTAGPGTLSTQQRLVHQPA